MFRETLWFKRSDLEAETVPLPIEDRYLDDGQVSTADSFEWGVRTGETTRLPPEVLDACKLDDEQPEQMQLLVREMKPRKAWIAAAAATLAALGAVLAIAF